MYFIQRWEIDRAITWYQNLDVISSKSGHSTFVLSTIDVKFCDVILVILAVTPTFDILEHYS